MAILSIGRPIFFAIISLAVKSIYTTKTPEETIELGMELASRLSPGSAVLLFGDLGAGKTHFTKGIAKGLGISELIKSPTFAYVNKHDITPNLHFYHYDLYRLNTGDEFHSIGLEESLQDPHSINIVEWADRLDGIHPKEYIRIDFRSFIDHHEIDIKFEDAGVVDDELVEKYWNDWHCPMHVREHQKQVAKVGVELGKALVEKNIIIDLSLLNTACLLHDMARVCDFLTLDRTKFTEEITDEKWAIWQDLREQFKGMHHADIAAGALLEDGYNKTAELIRLHNTLSILEEPEKFGLLEIAIVYYADKRVKHDEIVDLAERFRDGQERYKHHDDDEQKDLHRKAEEATLELEKQLFDLVDISPESIA